MAEMQHCRLQFTEKRKDGFQSTLHKYPSFIFHRSQTYFIIKLFSPSCQHFMAASLLHEMKYTVSLFKENTWEWKKWHNRLHLKINDLPLKSGK